MKLNFQDSSVFGVDGCKEGWVAVHKNNGKFVGKIYKSVFDYNHIFTLRKNKEVSNYYLIYVSLFQT